MRTFECGHAASKRPTSRSPLTALVSHDPWLAALEGFRARNPRRHDRLADYEQLLARGDHLEVGARVLAGEHRPEPPVEAWLNKADGRKKRVFQYPPLDELLFRTVNRLLQPIAAEDASSWCRSFVPGGGARSAFRQVSSDPAVAAKAALRLVVRDYFNSIAPSDLLAGLPAALAGDPLRPLLEAALLDSRVVRHGTVVDGGRKGIMAGTPLAPLLATLYLRDLDREVGGQATYARYSDDILVLAPPADLPGLERLLRTRLAARGLQVNERKSATTGPGQPWDFLGFRHHEGTVGLAPHTEKKFKARTTRLARRLLRWRERTDAGPERTARAFVRRVNLRLYGVRTERADFSWATWFLPLLDGPDGLDGLDAHVQREARYAATGRRTEGARRLVPYEALSEAGLLPLVSAYWALRRDPGGYDRLVVRRTGLV